MVSRFAPTAERNAVSPDTSGEDGTVRACQWDRPTAFSIAWTPREVRLTVGGTTIRHATNWLVGNAIHLSAVRGARLTVSRVKDQWVHTVVAGDPASPQPVDAWITDGGLANGWTIAGTLERSTPTSSDALLVTVGNDPTTPFDSRTRPKTFTGGITGP
jgi:hypothetical protein